MGFGFWVLGGGFFLVEYTTRSTGAVIIYIFFFKLITCNGRGWARARDRALQELSQHKQFAQNGLKRLQRSQNCEK